jgi:hypothetical protein
LNPDPKLITDSDPDLNVQHLLQLSRLPQLIRPEKIDHLVCLDLAGLAHQRHVEELLGLPDVLEPGQEAAFKVVPFQIILVHGPHYRLFVWLVNGAVNIYFISETDETIFPFWIGGVQLTFATETSTEAGFRHHSTVHCYKNSALSHRRSRGDMPFSLTNLASNHI